MSVGGVAGAVLPPHAATSTGTTVTHANVVLRESRDTAASDVVAGRPQDWDQRVRVAALADDCGGGATGGEDYERGTGGEDVAGTRSNRVVPNSSNDVLNSARSVVS